MRSAHPEGMHKMHFSPMFTWMYSFMPGLSFTLHQFPPPIPSPLTPFSSTPPHPCFQVHWWRSQAIRFLLRWTSPYLCHRTNRMRHLAFGREMARQVVQDHAEKLRIMRVLQGGAGKRESAGVEALSGAEVALAEGQSALLQDVWPGEEAARSGRRAEMDAVLEGAESDSVVSEEGDGGLDRVSCGARRYMQGEGGSVLRYVVPEEPVVPRPMVSIHVRQGDKGTEMRLLPLDAFILAAYRLKAHQPLLKNVWLSTEMQVSL